MAAAFACTALEERADERIRISKFNKRLMLNPQQRKCGTEFAVQRITPGEENVKHIFAENEHCSVYLKVIVEKDDYYALEGSLFEDAVTIKLINTKTRINEESTGWGTRFVLKSSNLTIQIYMSSGELSI